MSRDKAYEAFFSIYGNSRIQLNSSEFTVEALYLAIRERLLNDLMVDMPNSVHYGRLMEK
jgi:hypothetical protein